MPKLKTQILPEDGKQAVYIDGVFKVYAMTKKLAKGYITDYKEDMKEERKAKRQRRKKK